MSAYKVFLKDFPDRCEKILQRIEKNIRYGDLTVTGLLMVASSAIIIPYERLSPVPEKSLAHPSGDADKYAEAAKQFKELLDSKFLESRLYSATTTEKWRLARPQSVKGNPDEWNCSFKEISKDKTTKGVLYIMRNSLAHGNIFTKPERGEIQEIIFVSVELKRDNEGKPMPGELKHYNCISVTPYLFKQFLDKWFLCIKQLEIYPYVIDDCKEVA